MRKIPVSRSPESVSSSNRAPSKFFAVALLGKGGDLFKFSVERDVTDDPKASLNQDMFLIKYVYTSVRTVHSGVLDAYFQPKINLKYNE